MGNKTGFDEDEVVLYYGRMNGTVIRQIVKSESEKKSAFYNAIELMNKNFEAEGSNDGYVLMNDVVYCINPSLKHKKITGDEAKNYRRRVKTELKKGTFTDA